MSLMQSGGLQQLSLLLTVIGCNDDVHTMPDLFCASCMHVLPIFLCKVLSLAVTGF